MESILNERPGLICFINAFVLVSFLFLKWIISFTGTETISHAFLVPHNSVGRYFTNKHPQRVFKWEYSEHCRKIHLGKKKS